MENSEEEEYYYVLNKTYGGFSICEQCIKLYEKLSKKKYNKHNKDLEFRSDKNLIESIKNNHKDGKCKNSEIVKYKYPPEFYEINDYDGNETLNISEEKFDKLYKENKQLNIYIKNAKKFGKG